MPGVLLLPLKGEFGWDPGRSRRPSRCGCCCSGWSRRSRAALMQRYGMRGVVATALGMIVAGLALATRMTALWELMGHLGPDAGAGHGHDRHVLGATVANRWFIKRRGLVIGLLSASSATGQLLFLPVAAWLSDHMGWRMAMVPAGIAVPGLPGAGAAGGARSSRRGGTALLRRDRRRAAAAARPAATPCASASMR